MCLPNGTWANRADYGHCKPLNNIEEIPIEVGLKELKKKISPLNLPNRWFLCFRKWNRIFIRLISIISDIVFRFLGFQLHCLYSSISSRFK